MDQVQIDVVQPQLLHRGLNGLLGTLVAGVLNPQLGGNEQFLPGHTALGDGLAHGLLIHIGCCRVDEAVAGGDGVQYRLFADGQVRHLEHAEALQRHFHAVIQLDGLDFVHDRSPPVRINPF